MTMRRVPAGRRTYRPALLAFVLVACAAVVPAGLRHLRAVALLLRFETEGPPERLAAFGYHGVRVEEGTLATSGGRVRIRTYEPASRGSWPTLLLAHGVHHLGYEEPRLQKLAEALAEAGVEVVTPDLRALAEYRVTRAAERELGDLVEALARARGRRIGLFGISFAGGLAQGLATEPAVAARLRFVVSLGGHHDLARVARWFVAEGSAERHPYGPGVIASRFSGEVFGAQEDAVRPLLQLWLHDRGDEAYARLGEVPEPARGWLRALMDGAPSREFIDAYLAAVDDHVAEMRAASPAGRLARARVPVFLLHGKGDPVIPASESRASAAELPDDARAALLVSPALRHAETADVAAAEKWALVRFIAALLDALE